MLTSSLSNLIAKWLGYALLAGSVSLGDGTDGVAVIENIATGTGPASEARIAALDESRLVVGWCVAAGGEAGVYLRARTDFVWGTEAVRITDASAVNPRDLSLIHDAVGTLHAVWTDLDGEWRRVFHAALSPSLEMIRAPQPLGSKQASDSDYPDLAWDDTFGLLVVWQSAQSGRYVIKAVSLDPVTLIPRPMENPSGNGRMAISPQILSAHPATVAWHEVQDVSARTRMVRLVGGTQWEPWNPKGLDDVATTMHLPAVGLDSEDHPVLCWVEDGRDGMSSVRTARVGTDEWAEWREPAGDHRQPRLLVHRTGGHVVSWQVFTGGGRSIQVARTSRLGRTTPSLRISPASHRFAVDPDPAGTEAWSVVVWTDDLLDGGSGAVGFAEIHWADR